MIDLSSTLLERVRETTQLQTERNRNRPSNSTKRLHGSKREQRLLYWELFKCVQSNPHDHFFFLDQTFSASLPSLRQPQKQDVTTAANVLSRLPDTPFSSTLLDDPSLERRWDTGWAPQYLIPNAPLGGYVAPSFDLPWYEQDEDTRRKEHLENSRFLQVVKYWDTNSILIALALRTNVDEGESNHDESDREIMRDLLSYTSDLADLMETAFEVEAKIISWQTRLGQVPNTWVSKTFGIHNYIDSSAAIHARAIVLLYLWTAWQRAVMLLQFHAFGVQLRSPHKGRLHDLSVKGHLVLNDHYAFRADYLDAHDLPRYLCSWALALIQTRRDLVGMDIRILVQRFREQFGDRPARCIQEEEKRCSGRNAESCQRFISKPPAEQHFAHDDQCINRDCKLVPWNRTSYLSLKGSRAVRVDLPESCTANQLIYCCAGPDTLAISHVWSHGQGSRPEKGIHHCLHQRYSLLAKSLGCTSYWIDSTCIPDDESLRNEAIRGINGVFTGSKVTLVCDKDLMEIDFQDTQEIESWERVMATLLVCDWNIRAWTLLESIKGSRNLHLLTKHNRAQRFMTGLMLLYEYGSIDLVVLLSAAEHLIPSTSSTMERSIPFEEVGHTLSHRHASREGDDIIIWSLLSVGRPHRRIESFVCDVQAIRTGFLLSSSPRSDLEGFTWAPKTPRLREILGYTYPIKPLADEHYYLDTTYHSYSGEGSLTGQATEEGFRARWYVFLIENYEAYSKLAPWDWEIGHWTWEYIYTLLQKGWRIALLRAISVDGRSPWTSSDRQADFIRKVAVCISKCGKRWKWAGVYEEPNSICMQDDDSMVPFGVPKWNTKIHWQQMNIILI